MTFGLLFWIIMLLWLVLYIGAWMTPQPFLGHAHSLVLWVLLALLGWHVFGAMVHS
jgi:hypothetical protein